MSTALCADVCSSSMKLQEDGQLIGRRTREIQQADQIESVVVVEGGKVVE